MLIYRGEDTAGVYPPITYTLGCFVSPDLRLRKRVYRPHGAATSRIREDLLVKNATWNSPMLPLAKLCAA